MNHGTLIKTEPDVRSRRDARHKVAYHVMAFWQSPPNATDGPKEYRVTCETPRGWQVEVCAVPTVTVSLGTQPTVFVPDNWGYVSTLHIKRALDETIAAAIVTRERRHV